MASRDVEQSVSFYGRTPLGAAWGLSLLWVRLLHHEYLFLLLIYYSAPLHKICDKEQARVLEALHQWLRWMRCTRGNVGFGPI